MKLLTQILVLFATLPLTAGAQSKTSSRKDTYCKAAKTQTIYELCLLVNQERKKRKLAPLTLENDLDQVIQKHTNEMATFKYLSHNNRRGENPFDRLRNAGITYKKAAENVARGQRTPKDVLRAWMNSPGHRRNLLGPSYRSLGLGFKNYYWGQVFAAGKQNRNQR